MRTKIIAHRGDTKHHPENTLSAFEAALKNGADAIELDVHMTRDGELIVHHDYYLGNPDDGEGIIYKKEFRYISTLKVGVDEHIPTLKEVFDLVGDRLQYEIELKGFSEKFVVKVIDLVKDYNLIDKVEFTSPHAYILTRIKLLEPACKTGMFVVAPPSWMNKNLGQILVINNALLGNIDVLHCHPDLIDEQFVQITHAQKLLVHAADCNEEKVLREVFTMKVDQLSTNNLERALLVRE